MACLDCSPCQQGDPCYDNVGCLNPTTFECLSLPGDYPAIGVTNDMNGKEVLEAISQIVVGPSTDVNVKVSANDTTSSYLSSKVVGSNTINVSTLSPGSNERLKIDTKISADDGNKIIAKSDGLYATGNDDDHKVKVNASSTEDYLSALIVKGDDPLGIVSLNVAVVSGKLRITPTINITALCTALRQSGCLCDGPSYLNLS